MRVPHTLRKLNNVRLKNHIYTGSFSNLHLSARRSNRNKKSDSYHPFPLPSAINAIPPSPISQLPFPTSPLRGSWSQTPTSSIPAASLGQLQKLLQPYSGEKPESISASTTGEMLSIQHAEAVWLLYSSFPQAYRRTFPLSVLHQTFRQVVPRYSDIKILIGNPRTRNPSVVREHRRKVRKLAAEWEMRLRVVAGDILAPRRNSARQEGEKKKEVLHTPGVLTGGLRKLSILGDKTGCESILLELKSRFPPSLSSSSSDAASSSLPTVSPSEWRTLYDYSLRSVVRWLSLNIYRAPTAQGEILSAISSLKRLISGMQSQGVPAGEQTALVLLDAGRYTSSPAAVQVQKVREGFEDLTRVILEGGYGIKRRDVGGLGLGWEGLKVELPTQVKLAVIEMMGREGNLWGMITAFEKMYPDLSVPSPAPASATTPTSTMMATSASVVGEFQENMMEAEATTAKLTPEEVIEEEIPTLSSMMAKERAAKAERDWLGRVRHSDTDASDISASTSANTAILAESAESTEPAEMVEHEPSYRRSFSTYLPSIPMPLSLLPSSSSEPARACVNLADFDDANSIPPDYMIKTMLHYIYLHRHPDPEAVFHGGRGRPNVREMGLYVCRAGLRFAALEQVRWLSQIVTTFSSSTLDSTFSRPTLKITQPRIHPNPLWFNTALRIVLSSAGRNKKAIGKTVVLKEEIEALERRLEEEIRVLEMLRTSGANAANVVNASATGDESSVDTSEGQLNDITTSTPSLTPNSNINIDIRTHLESLQTKLDQLASLKEEIQHRQEVVLAGKRRAKDRAAEAQAIEAAETRALIEARADEAVAAAGSKSETKMKEKEQGKEVDVSGVALG
ncbi:hypothetical protein C343_02693 [Cryptococcus neoformans C23]|uniref:Uncharacterized protein n=1 Tax=Cryptococcus neoformans (strain H99 / ATCC 208821 / CBS 10515 / FGSC 9487) TaxID=235443 RepID=J9VSD0_CRYN9|nr:hypothetical protein CNAG_06864 [Cryptococcus neoformans var. grubii H99]AFR94615.1 hypothetical protein CNAG_06864 [Cryptococcus neoformans var. grubii H99]AUB24299.1 hypothetical protein CKF44_06864 [Cryptococcus neoformans var. grubii]OWZ32076.1 hypothetical protein C347_02765 [Cryptococcus neoformans var. grubii AD2-60a]OWZ44744.1 hypothetical protein C343_02693 [Cryptococcus neoformans var. grubii C23]|eukprot:XP_012049604.1 hypothetical protein CNAG_06864 [Cryptococcus neoformans var. grubii H99]